MRLGAYVLMLFSMSLVFFLMGYDPLLLSSANSYSQSMNNTYTAQGGSTLTEGGVIGAMAGVTLEPNIAIATIIGALVAAYAASLVMGFSAIYIIPMAILIGILNLLIFPISFIVDPSVPQIISIPAVVLMNIFLILSILSFVRGGNA